MSERPEAITGHSDTGHGDTEARRRISLMLVVVATMSACSGTASSSTMTGLTGKVTRGPVTPVCRVDVPCDAPFSATFTVQRAGRQVAQFQSDALGQFTVLLAPGDYTIVPGADAPIIAPSSQVKPVIVENTEVPTVVQLMFDTGIR